MIAKRGASTGEGVGMFAFRQTHVALKDRVKGRCVSSSAATKDRLLAKQSRHSQDTLTIMEANRKRCRTIPKTGDWIRRGCWPGRGEVGESSVAG
jgi:hypothetical protein